MRGFGAPDKRFAAAFVRNKGVFLIELRGANTVRSPSGKTTDVRVFEFSPDSTLLAAGTEGGSVRFWSVATGQLIADVNVHDGPIRDLAFHPRLKSLVTAGADGRVQMTDWPRKPLKFESISDEITALAASHDGAWLAGAGPDGATKVWRVAEGKLVGIARA